MKKKTILGLGLCTILLVTLAGCTTPPDNGEQTDPKIQAILDAGKLVVGTNAEYAPWESVDENGDYVGFDIDFAQYIADYFGVELNISDMAFDESVFAGALDNDEVDLVIAALTRNDERALIMSLSNPYFFEGQVVIVNETNDNITGETDLLNKTVGVMAGTTSVDAAKEYVVNDSLVISYNNYGEAMENLTAGVIDAIVIDSRAGQDLVEGTDGVKIVGEPFTVEYYCVAVKKGESAFKDEIDKAIAKFQSDGTKELLEDKWL